MTRNRLTNILLSDVLISGILDLQPSTQRSVFPDYQTIYPKIIIVHILGRRHTDEAFGRDSAANSATMHWIRYHFRAPVNSHQSRVMEGCALTASEGKDQAFGVRDAAGVAGLGERESENVMPCVFMSLPAISLLCWTCLPLAHLPFVVLFF